MPDLSDMLRALREERIADALSFAREAIASSLISDPEVLSLACQVVDRAIATDTPLDELSEAVAKLRPEPATLQFAAFLGQKGETGLVEQVCGIFLGENPDHPHANLLMAGVFEARDDGHSALACYLRALSGGLNSPMLHYNVGSLHSRLGDVESAKQSYRAALALNPDLTEARCNLALLVAADGDMDLAADLYTEGLARAPENQKIRQALASLLIRNGHGYVASGENTLAESCYRQAMDLDDSLAEAWFGLANVEQSRGHYVQAERLHRKALEIDPDLDVAWSNLLMLLNYCCGNDRDRVYTAHREAASRFMENRKSVACGRKGKVRVAYLSADFWQHAVMSFLLPVLEHHNRDHFEIICYSDVRSEDGVTKRIKSLSLDYQSVCRDDTDALCQRIQDDRVDILVDLCGHTANNRLAVFAKSPAPVQVSWLGYPNTTGMDQIDYRLGDAVVDREDAQRFYTERLIRMAPPFLCFRPLVEVVPLHQAIERSGNGLTFGSFNTLAKITDDVINTWKRILSRVPGSRLLLKCAAFRDRGAIHSMRERLSVAGIRDDRIELVPPVGSYREHLESYARIDIALDTFPYNGTTTTCEALWMGVPVVTLEGIAHAARVGTMLLTVTGLEKYIAKTDQDYVDIAVSLANNREERKNLHENLRDRVENSPLCDERAFVRKLEDTYVSMIDERP